MEDQVQSETVTKVLYPNDEPEVGKGNCGCCSSSSSCPSSLQDILHLLRDFAQLPFRSCPTGWPSSLPTTPTRRSRWPNWMRLLIDEHALDWDEAWEITVASLAYTNHTLLGGAGDPPLSMFARFLPRHLEIIYEINRRFLDEVRAKFPGDDARVRRMSLIGEDGNQTIRMAHLATVGSHAINGVAALHSICWKETVLKDFYEMWPERFSNKTNGVTPRRSSRWPTPACATCSTTPSAGTG